MACFGDSSDSPGATVILSVVFDACIEVLYTFYIFVPYVKVFRRGGHRRFLLKGCNDQGQGPPWTGDLTELLASCAARPPGHFKQSGQGLDSRSNLRLPQGHSCWPGALYIGPLCLLADTSVANVVLRCLAAIVQSQMAFCGCRSTSLSVLVEICASR